MPEFYTLQEVSRALKVTVRTLHNWHSSGKIAFHKMGERTRISREELERFLKAGAEPRAEG